MAMKLAGWFCLISVIITGLLGFGCYLSFLSLFASFFFGIFTVLYFSYDQKKIFPADIDVFDNPLQQTNFSIQIQTVLELFQQSTPIPKYDNRITGSETVDSFLNEIITIIINDYVTPWYEILTDDDEFTDTAIRRLVLAAGVNVSNRVKGVDWIYLLSTRFPEELTTHLKLFKQSRVRLKHVDLMSAKDLANGSKTSPKKDEKKTHRRNKSDTDLSWPADAQTFGKSKFYDSTENLTGKTLKDIFFELECSIENRQICRDIFCIDSEREYELLCEISEAVLYLIAPEEAWRCHALKVLLIELVSSVVLRPIISLLSDPDCINRTIVRYCCRDSCLPSELFLIVIRSCGDAEELDATLDLVQKDIQKLHSKDSAGEWELQDRQKLSSLQYLVRIIQAKRATLGPQEGSNSAIADKISEEVSRSLKFIRATAAWRSNAQYLLEIEMNEADAPHTSKAVLDNLRSSALELCDLYLSPNRPAVMGIPENCHSELVRKITTEGEEFTDNPVICFDDVQKCVCDALELDEHWPYVELPWDIHRKRNALPISCFLSEQGRECELANVRVFLVQKQLPREVPDKPAQEDDPSWQSDFMMDSEEGAERSHSEFKRDVKADNRKYSVVDCTEKCKRLMKSCLNQLPKLFSKSKFKYDCPYKSSTFPRTMLRRTPNYKNHTLPKCKIFADTLPLPGSTRHNRSRSDIVGNIAQNMINESAGVSGPSSLSSVNNNLSLSHSEISKNTRNIMSPLTACIIETALVQEKGKAFGIYAIAVTRLADGEVWHIYRRYSDFYDLHGSIKDKWPELGNLPFPAKKTFQNTSRTVLENRKRMLNNYLQSLANLAREAKYLALLSQDYLGGFLSPENNTEKHSNSIDAVLVNSLRAGMRTLKNMPDQFANTVDGVMDGISKVFQGKSGESEYEGLNSANATNSQDDDESVPLKLLEEILGIRGLWLRRRLLAPLRTMIADRVNRKVLEFVSSLTSPRNVVQYLKTFKQWLTSRNGSNYANRDAATKARTRVAAKVALLSACSDELKHIVGTDSTRRGLLTVFDLFQTQEINRRLIFVLLEVALTNLFPDNDIQGLFRKLYSNSPRVPVPKKSVNV